MPKFLLIVLMQYLLVAGCATSPAPGAPEPADRTLAPNEYEVFGKVYQIMPSNLGYLEIGIASWYGKKFHGRYTAMGEVYDMFEMTAAHKSLPLPTAARVTNLDNGRSIVVRINDRGPFHDDRLIDLSWGAARALGFEHQGTAPVVVEALDHVNHPEIDVRPDNESYYLQVGAFGQKQGASRRLEAVRQALPEDIPLRILTSETETAMLYKVWVGPIDSLEEELRLEALIKGRNLGNPIRVKVE